MERRGPSRYKRTGQLPVTKEFGGTRSGSAFESNASPPPPPNLPDRLGFCFVLQFISSVCEHLCVLVWSMALRPPGFEQVQLSDAETNLVSAMLHNLQSAQKLAKLLCEQLLQEHHFGSKQ